MIMPPILTLKWPQEYQILLPQNLSTNIIANIRHTWLYIRVRHSCNAEKIKLSSEGGDSGNKKRMCAVSKLSTKRKISVFTRFSFVTFKGAHKSHGPWHRRHKRVHCFHVRPCKCFCGATWRATHSLGFILRCKEVRTLVGSNPRSLRASTHWLKLSLHSIWWSNCFPF
jgi:hypothetical protein